MTSSATWNVTDTSIAVINEKGTATGQSVGTVEIAATYTDGDIEKTGIAELDVLAAPPSFDSLTIEGNSIVPIGVTEHLDAILTLSDGKRYTVNDKVNWTSSDSAVATVTASGDVRGVAEGKVVITAAAKNNSSIMATHAMTVTAATLTKIQIEKGYSPDTPTPITSLDVPITTDVYITAWGIYSDGSREYINTDTVWWSSDQQIASINYLKSSYVYGRDTGTATITAAYQGLKAELSVTVLPQDPALTSIELI
ncbi:Ig-like domain-containing protein [Sulfurovum sp.]|uniref:Ig-like domain-containing protein n=1 Tax=Sulfurovum sp. TaxID=1969726 RepID=UPI0025CCB2D3|nr:Ig-like domain-containing protein [Sulfurovum sp.]